MFQHKSGKRNGEINITNPDEEKENRDLLLSGTGSSAWLEGNCTVQI